MSRLIQALEHWAATRPNEVALQTSDRTWTWGELQQEVERAVIRLDAALPASGPVVTQMDNGAGWVVTDLALIRLGRVHAPLPPFFTQQQVMGVCQDLGARSLILPGRDIEIGGQMLGVSQLAFGSRPLHPGTAKVTYTSGSTGGPKGVCLSQSQLEATASALVEALGAEYAGVHLAILPLGVLLENVAGLYPILLAGGAYRVLSLAEIGFAQPFRPDFARMADAVIEGAATSLILPPEILRGFLAAKGGRSTQLKLVAVGGAKVSASLLQAARAAGVPAYEGYGLSECGSVVALNTPRAERVGTVGRVLPHLSVSVDPEGEVIIERGGFLGYVGAPPATGPLKTGDLGALDSDGFLSIHGRRSNVLITGFGRNVSPEWVESELLAQPEIAQVMVFGEGQAALGALIVGSGRGVVAAAVARANAGLPEYARIARWKAVPAFDPAKGELTANGRPRRSAISAAYADFIQSSEEEPCPSFPA